MRLSFSVAATGKKGGGIYYLIFTQYAYFPFYGTYLKMPEQKWGSTVWKFGFYVKLILAENCGGGVIAWCVDLRISQIVGKICTTKQIYNL